MIQLLFKASEVINIFKLKGFSLVEILYPYGVIRKVVVLDFVVLPKVPRPFDPVAVDAYSDIRAVLSSLFIVREH